MPKVTGLRLSRTKTGRVNVYLDNHYTFSLGADVVNRVGLQLGQELSDSQIEELREADLVEKGAKAAFQYLSYRPRSEKEIRQRLSRRGFDNVMEKVVERLKGQGLVDDVAFAQFWKDNRISFKPRSQRLLRRELIQKGVAEEVVAEVLGDIDDGLNAIAAGRRKARLLANNDYPEFRHRLTTYLRGRGFSYDTINSAVVYLWQEMQSERAA